MTAQNRTTLKGYFNDGDVPTEQDFIDLIDSLRLLAEPTWLQDDDKIVVASNVTWSSGATTYDLSSFGIPAGIRSVHIRFIAVSPAVNNQAISVRPKNSTSDVLMIRNQTHQGATFDISGWVPTDSTDGDIEVYNYSGSNWTGGYIWVFGYDQ